jgi:tryptophan synthase alpha chain
MNRIAQKFEQLRSAGRKGFIPFVSAGDPDLQTTLTIITTLAESGADIIELGVPFSDPMADGPVIQASSQRALEAGTRLTDILELVRTFRTKSDTPIVLFSYLNPIYRFGIERLAFEAASAGIDGVLITDVVDAEAAEISLQLRKLGVDLISLIAPTTSDERLERIASSAAGFIYAVARAGVTGMSQNTGNAAEALVNRVRRYTELPIAVGFGISTADQIEAVWKYADAAVVGSAIVAVIERARTPADAVYNVSRFVRQLVPRFAKSTEET